MTILGWLSRLGRKSPKIDTKPDTTFAIYASQPSVTTIIVTMMGVDAAQIDEILDVTTMRFGVKHKIIYITDSLDFMRFRNREAIFEYLPSVLEQKLHSGEISWNSFLAKRWQLLLSKWRPIHVISYGQNIEAFLAAAPKMPPRADR